ncbi:DNA-binding transcriptional MerR regulator [Breznakia sp. PF5-3]|uniref:MerR family transcriptional regulator n=1 Tax=unclassified Breznakia TaxID=2623764 RepID=UPI00240516EA|nr:MULTISPECIES: MerR family transcriptional regulator [unclassified Breznakia]MDF9825632.1 DNA-binding transcriptional MerR regulator [Breznakia sp. PM6-1]MDF9836454.1 DNA-binding transcriptional MerR regulator [Breznakia sp. PF5-3]MDF9838633.1 DNA-binding transcriptional MerR regulator [Breznakia sp. PFB2-8]MDF9860664.1 DNA-binding transcriptional MerR regulator [Breznakia sp. PH5-24]
MEKIDREIYLSTGEFAKMVGIRRKHLIYYDEIGLFSPEIVLDNGYRYYYYRQLYTLNMILTLKEIGMSLEEIKQFTDNRNPDSMISIFKNQNEKVEKEIEKLTLIKDMMKVHVETAQLAKSVKVGSIQVLDFDEEPIFVGSDNIFEEDEKPLLSKAISRFYKNVSSQGYSFAFPIGFYIDYEQYKRKNFKFTSHFYYRVARSKECKPAGKYIVLYECNAYSDRNALYERIFAYAKKHHYKLTGYIYEDNLLNEITAKDPKEYILRISIRIDE